MIPDASTSPKPAKNAAPPPPNGSPVPPPDGASKAYQPSAVEPRITAKWAASKAFHADSAKVLSGEKKPYAILIPPPNVTGALHLGHALNNTLQDILTRAHRMMGFETLWMPGTDHAGIATQAVVERRLKKEQNKTRKDFTREQFIALVQEWKDEYEARITGQLKAMGCSCDFDRQRFTMDDICARAVREAFFRLFKDGLIYRGKRLVNWDPALQTAVADDECYEEEHDSFFYYLRYPLVHPQTGKNPGSDPQPVTWDELASRGYPGASQHPADQPAWITVATTRPETYLGDTAVAVNPKDHRAKSLRGLFVELPLVGRVIPIVEDDYVVLPAAMWPDREEAKNDPKAQYATGFLKVTPAHDQNDYELGMRHKLPMVNVFAPDASISDKHGWSDPDELTGAHIFLHKSREDARKLVLREFESHGLLEKPRPYRQSLKHSDRSKAVIEPYLSDQWYVRVTDDKLAGAANRALVPDQRTTGILPVANATDSRHGQDARATDSGDGSMRFYPARYAKTYEQWHDNIRDWCISRQLWWGHRIPVWRSSTWKIRESVANQPTPTRGIERDIRIQEKLALWQAEGRVCAWGDVPGSVDRPSSLLTGHDPDRFVCVRDVNDREAVDFLETNFFEQDPDVLDTWFSSALWPLSTMGWPGSTEYVIHLIDPADDAGPDGIAPREKAIAAIRSYLQAEGVDKDTSIEVESRTGFEFVWLRVVVCSERAMEVVRTLAPVTYTKDESEARYQHHLKGPPEGDKLAAARYWIEGGKEGTDLLWAFNPTTVLSTAREIITLWVSRMVMMNRYFTGAGAGRGDIPFHDVFIHAVVQDGDGKKMSKTAGNGVDPLDIIESHGADAMRYTLAQMTTNTQDVRMPVRKDARTGKNTSEKFDAGRNFCNKLWNASRFAISILQKGAPSASSGESSATIQNPSSRSGLSLPDRWLLSRLAKAVRACEISLANYEFSDYCQTIYQLLWWDFCDWYLEAIKPTVDKDANQRAVLRAALDVIIRLLHPVAPFITEEVHAMLRQHPAAASLPGISLASADLLCTSAWPAIDAALIDEPAEQSFESLRELVTIIRNVRSEHQVLPKRRVTLHCSSAAATRITSACPGLVENLAGLEAISPTRPAQGAAHVAFRAGGEEMFLSNLADAIDAGAEKDRLTKQLEQQKKSEAALAGRLNNPGYADKAPPKLVEESKAQLAKIRAEIAAIETKLKTL